MNERIKELTVQCWIVNKYGPPYFDYEKFAELIIQECMDIVDDHSERKLAKHFGVE